MSNAPTNGLIDPCYEIDIVEDANEAVRRARAETRVILAEDGQPPVAVIPLIDLQLLLQLEDAELDRIDAEDLRELRESDEYLDRVTWDEVKMASHP